MSQEIDKTRAAYHTFLSTPKTPELYQDYFSKIDRLEQLTRSPCLERDLRLAENIPAYLAAKTLVENPSQSIFDGKALTDVEFLQQAQTILWNFETFHAQLENRSTTPKVLGNHLYNLYYQFGRFCTMGATHAARIQRDSDFALSKTHRKSLVLFTDTLFSLVQKQPSSKQEILEALETGEERYLSLLPLLALYQQGSASAEIFQSIAHEIPLLNIGKIELNKLHKQMLNTDEEPISDAQKKGAALLGKLSKTENQLLTGIMRFAIGETVKALKIHQETSSYPLFIAALIREQAIAPLFISNDLAPEIKTSLPKELNEFTLEQLTAPSPGTPEYRAVEAANRILCSELFGPLPNYRILYFFGS